MSRPAALGSNIDKDLSLVKRDLAGLIGGALIPIVIIGLYASVRLDSGETPAKPPHAESLIMCLSIWLAGLSISLEALAGERTLGILTRLRTTRTSDAWVAVSKWFVLGTIITAQAALLTLAAHTLLELRLGLVDGIRATAVLVALGIVGVALGLLVSAAMRSPAQRGMFLTLGTLASITLSGFIAPLSQMGLAEPFARWLPYTLAYQELRQLILGEGSSPWPVAILLAEGCILLGVTEAIVRLRRP